MMHACSRQSTFLIVSSILDSFSFSRQQDHPKLQDSDSIHDGQDFLLIFLFPRSYLSEALISARGVLQYIWVSYARRPPGRAGPSPHCKLTRQTMTDAAPCTIDTIPLLSLDAALGLRISNLSGHLYRMSCTTASCTCTKDQACALDFIVIHPKRRRFGR